mgnify:FL=1
MLKSIFLHHLLSHLFGNQTDLEELCSRKNRERLIVSQQEGLSIQKLSKTKVGLIYYVFKIKSRQTAQTSKAKYVLTIAEQVSFLS